MAFLIIIIVVSIAFTILYTYYLNRYISNEPHFTESPYHCYLMVMDKIKSAESYEDLNRCIDYVNDSLADWIYEQETKSYYDNIIDKITDKKHELNYKEFMQISMN